MADIQVGLLCSIWLCADPHAYRLREPSRSRRLCSLTPKNSWQRRLQLVSDTTRRLVLVSPSSIDGQDEPLAAPLKSGGVFSWMLICAVPWFEDGDWHLPHDSMMHSKAQARKPGLLPLVDFGTIYHHDWCSLRSYCRFQDTRWGYWGNLRWQEVPIHLRCFHQRQNP